MAIREYVFKGKDNPNVVTVDSSDTDTPLAGVTRMTVALCQARVTYDSDTDPTAITWDDTSFTLSLNDKPITGLQDAEVTAYDVGHPDGQAIASPGGPSPMRLELQFVEGC